MRLQDLKYMQGDAPLHMALGSNIVSKYDTVTANGTTLNLTDTMKHYALLKSITCRSQQTVTPETITNSGDEGVIHLQSTNGTDTWQEDITLPAGFVGGALSETVYDEITADGVPIQRIKKVTLSAGSTWTLSDAEPNSTVKSNKLPATVLYGTTLNYPAGISTSFDVYYQLATPITHTAAEEQTLNLDTPDVTVQNMITTFLQDNGYNQNQIDLYLNYYNEFKSAKPYFLLLSHYGENSCILHMRNTPINVYVSLNANYFELQTSYTNYAYVRKNQQTIITYTSKYSVLGKNFKTVQGAIDDAESVYAEPIYMANHDITYSNTGGRTPTPYLDTVFFSAVTIPTPPEEPLLPPPRPDTYFPNTTVTTANAVKPELTVKYLRR